MKGIVFTGLLEMVEKRFGYVVANDIIVKSNLPSEGVYTSVGTYDYKEMQLLVNQLSVETGLSGNALLEAFGTYYFEKLAAKAVDFFSVSDGLFVFLSKVETYIHPEVLKLYPEAQLPTFVIEEQSENRMLMLYQSKRRMEYFAFGLLKGAISFFGEKAEVSMEGKENGDTLFLISKQ